MFARKAPTHLYWAAATLSGLVAAWPAKADDVSMTIEVQSTSAAYETQLSVSGASGLYDQVRGFQLNLPLSLKAKMTADAEDRKIVTWELRLKADDKGAVRAFNGTPPESQLSLAQTFTFGVDANSPVALDAITACNAEMADRAASATAVTVSMSVPVVWRVTTGKFNFPWTNYELVMPSDEFVKNPDFYADRKTFEQQTTARVMVSCEPPSPQPAPQADVGGLHLGERLITHFKDLESGGVNGNGR